MNLLRFAWKTAPVLVAVPLSFTYGVITNLLDGQLGAALVLFLAGLALCLAALLGVSLHRARRIHGEVSQLLLRILHNGDLGHLPHLSERQGREWLEQLRNDPSKPTA